MTSEPNSPRKHLGPGQINLDLIPVDFPLTPLRGKKAYLPGWTTDPKTLNEIKKELEEGRATGVGLLCGQWSNELALIMVDIDGEEAIPEIESLGGGCLESIFPPTLTVSSGKTGRMRMVFRVPTDKIQFIPDKATIKVGKGPWEILWRSRQGAIMGAHPDTDGYRTTNNGGFEHCKNLPEMPEWLYAQIQSVYPSTRYRKKGSSSSTAYVAQSINISYEEGSPFSRESTLEEAREYLNTLNPERADEYEEWIAIGMALHQIDEDLLGDWIEWSAQSDSFEDGCCEEKWESFERLPGGHSPGGARGLKTLRAKAKEDGYVNMGGFEVPNFEVIAKRIEMEHGINVRDIDSVPGAGYFDFEDEEFDGEDVDKPVKKKTSKKNPPSSEIANILHSQMMKNGWKYDPKFDVFMRYDETSGVWNRQEHEKDFKHDVQFEVAKLDLPNGYSTNYINDICSLLEGTLTNVYWNDDQNCMTFMAIDTKTKKEKYEKYLNKIRESKANKYYEKLKRKVTDLHWKTAKEIAENYETVIIGKFSMKKVNEGEIAEIVKRVGTVMRHFDFRSKLVYKCLSKGTKIKVQDEKFTTKMCSVCGYYNKEVKSEKKILCGGCKELLDRDKYSARGILIKSLKE